MLHPLSLARLEAALAQPGCPVCWEMERSSRHYLARVLREHKGSQEVWARLRQNWGLCPPHTRGLLAEEAQTIRGFSAATLYRWLTETLLREAGRLGAGGSRPGRGRFRALLKPSAGCLACQQLGEYERAVTGGLVRTLSSGEPPTVREAYLRGDGLCLPHLRIALDVAEDPDTADLLTEHFCDQLQALAGRLDAFLEAHTADGAVRRTVDPDAWLRAAERFSGRLR